MPKGIKGFQKGNTEATKNESLVVSRRMRDTFIDSASKVWNKLIQRQLKDAMFDIKARQYVIDQVIGRPKETLEMDTPVMVNIDKAIVMQINKLYDSHEGNGKHIGNGKAEV